MPLIEKEAQGKKSAIRFELDSDAKQMLMLYCEFSQNKKPDPVIVGALKLLYRTDPDFGPWLERKRQEGGSANQTAPGPKPPATPAKTESADPKRH